MEDVRHPEHGLVELDPVVHLPELDVADEMIEPQEADAGVAVAVRRDRDEAGQERAGVVGAIDERVDRVAVRRDRRALDLPELVLDGVRLGDAARAARNGLAIRLRRVGHGERDVLDAVAVLREVARDLVLLAQRARDDEADLALLEDVRGAVAHSRLRPRVRRAREAHRVLVEVGGLLRVPDPELEVVPGVERHEVFGHARSMSVGPKHPPRREGDEEKPDAGEERELDPLELPEAARRLLDRVREAGTVTRHARLIDPFEVPPLPNRAHSSMTFEPLVSRWPALSLGPDEMTHAFCRFGDGECGPHVAV